MGAKSMSESPYNPVAAALGNALADATGIRFTAVPFKPDRFWPLLNEKFGDKAVPMASPVNSVADRRERSNGEVPLR